MKISLIYAYWPNQPFEATWCDLPWALRNAGLPKALSAAGHEILETFLRPEDPGAEELLGGFTLAKEIADEVAKARAEDELPIILCGSCTVAAVGAVAGLGGTDTGIAWFDAHPDLNTPDTTTSGLFEGMALAVATGHCWREMARKQAGLEPADLKNVALYGARDIDIAEQALIEDNEIPLATIAEAINLRLADTRQTYVHLDMDVHDALSVRTNSYAVPGGPGVEELRETLVGIDDIGAISITGLDPSAQDADRACQLAIDHLKAITAELSSVVAKPNGVSKDLS